MMIEVIYILCLRQFKHYCRSKERLIISLGQPILFLIALGFGFGPMYSRVSGGENYIQFLAPGIVAMEILSITTLSGREIIWDRRLGFLRETMVAPISRTEIMIGNTLGVATIAVIQGLIVFSLAYIIGFRFPNLNSLFLGLIFMFLVAIFFAGFGITIALQIKDIQSFQTIRDLLIVPLFFLSGAFFPLTNLPSTIYLISRINPLTYGVDGLRGAIVGISTFGIYYDLAVIGTLSFIICAIERILFSKNEV